MQMQLQYKVGGVVLELISMLLSLYCKIVVRGAKYSLKKKIEADLLYQILSY